jgi:hypothetical protein
VSSQARLIQFPLQLQATPWPPEQACAGRARKLPRGNGYEKGASNHHYHAQQDIIHAGIMAYTGLFAEWGNIVEAIKGS